LNALGSNFSVFLSISAVATSSRSLSVDFAGMSEKKLSDFFSSSS